jgi:iron(III) transport system substrate-binding protein
MTVAVAAAGCGDTDNAGSSTSSITVYSGRGEDLIQPVFDLFEERTGISVNVRYGGSSEMALLIDTEGDRSPADVFISQSPGAVGFLEQQGRLVSLSEPTLSRVSEEFAASDGRWIGITGRVRVLVYNTDNVDPADLPSSVLDLVSSDFAGRVGVAPNNGSFQDFVTALRSQLGDDATLSWLEGMASNESPNYPKNSAIVDAVARGEVDMGLVNHYYLVEALEEDPSLPAANHVFPEGDLGSLLIVSAAAVLDSSDDPAAAESLIEFLLSDEAQELSANAEKEYPLVAGVAQPEGLVPLADLAAAVIDLNVLAGGLAGTQELIDQSDIRQ